MSASTAIGMVSQSLKNLLEKEMKIESAPDVTIKSPDEGGGNKRINLFLYRVQENPTLKNLDWQLKQGEPSKLVPPPLSLNLFYLMTPYATDDVTAHEILGVAMRVFYENPIVPETYLAQELQGAREQIRIMLNPLDMEELSTVWNTFTKPFRLSVLYEVSVVQLDMLPESERVMAKRVRHIGPPDVRAPFVPPVVEDMEPVSGSAGTLVTFHGKNLSGWWVYVRVMREAMAPQELTSDHSFQVALPDDLPPGFHQIRVDISHLFRRIFFFEVTE